LEFAPKRIWTDASKESRAYSEMCTGDWWWDVQVSTATAVVFLVLTSSRRLSKMAQR
jgi:hypothetical protein